MNQFHEAADAIRRAAKQHEVYVAAAALLDQAGSFEQAAQEAEGRCAQAQATLARVNTEVGEAREQLAQTISLCRDHVEKANDVAKSIVDKAQEGAKEVIAKATEAAEARAAEVIDAATATAAGLRSKADDLRVRIATSEGRLAALDEEVAAKQARVDELNAAIAGLREKLGV